MFQEDLLQLFFCQTKQRKLRNWENENGIGRKTHLNYIRPKKEIFWLLLFKRLTLDKNQRVLKLKFRCNKVDRENVYQWDWNQLKYFFSRSNKIRKIYLIKKDSVLSFLFCHNLCFWFDKEFGNVSKFI